MKGNEREEGSEINICLSLYCILQPTDIYFIYIVIYPPEHNCDNRSHPLDPPLSKSTLKLLIIKQQYLQYIYYHIW